MLSRVGNRIGQLFRMSAPSATHRRPATCKEVKCPHYLQGWITRVSAGSPQELYIRHHSERRFAEKVDGDTVEFRFYPGQNCFRQHSTTLDRPPFLLHRKNGPMRRIIDPQDFNDTFNEEIHRLEQARRRG